MLKKYKVAIVLSSIVILIPMLFGLIMWNELPDTMTTHWGADGVADGWSGKAFTVFGLPAILLGMHLLCLLVSTLDKKQPEQNHKAMRLVFWIIPAISLVINGMLYQVAFGKDFNITFFMPLLMGTLFLAFGNYMPKVKQNSTLGIKLSWTLNNEENWNRTHRLAGKLWVAGGLVIFGTTFLPTMAMVVVALCVTLVMVAIPMVYSYCIYRKHRASGVEYTAAPKSKAEKTVQKIMAVVGPLILVGVAVLMFTGKVEVRCEDTAFTVNATYWTELQVEYTGVDTLEYRETLDVGVRANGFASARLSLGIFQNEEFGNYTLYSYTGAKGFVVLTAGEKTLVIGLQNAGDAQALYETLQGKVKE